MLTRHLSSIRRVSLRQARVLAGFASILALGLAGCERHAHHDHDHDHGHDHDHDHQESHAVQLKEGEPLQVAVSIPPQADFLQRLGGDRVEVDVFVAAGQDPHHFAATPQQVMGLADTHAFFTIGMPFEKTLAAKIKKSVPDLHIIDMSSGEAHDDHEDHDDHHAHEDSEHGEDEEAAHEEHAGEGGDDHDHGHGHAHDFDPHIWLSPPLIREFAGHTVDALAELDPDGADTYRENLKRFQGELDQLHQELEEQLAPCRGRTFYVYHPAFTHFAEAYGLKQKSIEAEGRSPTPKELMELIEQAKNEGVRVIFVQPQFDPSSAEKIAESIDAKVATIDPLSGDVLANLRYIARTLAESMAGQTAP